LHNNNNNNEKETETEKSKEIPHASQHPQGMPENSATTTPTPTNPERTENHQIQAQDSGPRSR